MNIKIKNIVLGVAAVAAMLAQGSLSAIEGISQVSTEQAPKAIGPYSQGVRVGDALYVSGQIPVDPVTGKFAGDTIDVQTRQVIANLEAILASQGMTLENVVKTTVYLKDLKDFAAMNAVYGEKFFFDVKPARATIQVAKLPLDALIEIECVAYMP